MLNDCADERQTETRAKKKGPLTMLMDEMGKDMGEGEGLME